jgi:hypothetical protein
MKDDPICIPKTVKYSAIAVGVLMVAGVLTVTVLAQGKTGMTKRSRALSPPPCYWRACLAWSLPLRLFVSSVHSTRRTTDRPPTTGCSRRRSAR